MGHQRCTRTDHEHRCNHTHTHAHTHSHKCRHSSCTPVRALIMPAVPINAEGVLRHPWACAPDRSPRGPACQPQPNLLREPLWPFCFPESTPCRLEAPHNGQCWRQACLFISTHRSRPSKLPTGSQLGWEWSGYPKPCLWPQMCGVRLEGMTTAVACGCPPVCKRIRMRVWGSCVQL